MSDLTHRIYVYTLASIVILVTIYLFYKGLPYYSTPLEERFYHPDHDLMKPSGLLGHGLGIVGTLLIILGVFGYMARKRYKFLSRLGRLKYWLEFHIFLCCLGPVMILFHTAFKFGGIVSVSFWSMVAVVISGVIGRFIYLQIPRTIEGRELSLGEIKQMKTNVQEVLQSSYQLNPEGQEAILYATQISHDQMEGNLFNRIIKRYLDDKQILRNVRKILKQNKLKRVDQKKIIRLIKNELSLNNRIDRLHSMQQLFKYWHVAHLPFALIMLIIMVIHVGITLAFGYRWIF